MGSEQLWDQAEQALRNVLDARGVEYRVNEGDGAFYGPEDRLSYPRCVEAKLAVRNNPA